ncbi:EAL domain-containing protein [Bacillus sp. AFS040349]|uniref:EAL domain-containing protein n=1 Tax=Bacillus sp. AFS040349 TaxID=2033502 RepID=UPI00159BD6CB|nr:EAL domain-containing protein [Bacillus sp. AFS040349]
MPINEGNIYHHFQPIFSLKDKKRIGYEGLLRSNDFSNPELFFQQAIINNQLFQLDTLSVYKALKTFRTNESNEKLFLNIFPSTIIHHEFLEFLNKLATEKLLLNQNITFELSEVETVRDLAQLKERIAILRNYGISIAFDDVGKGKAYIQDIIELDPEYIKLDRYFSQDLHRSEKKQAFIYLILEYCRRYNNRVILEGIETVEDLQIAQSLSVPLGQGFLLGRPQLLTNYADVSNG